MIKVTRLNGKELIINAELIETVEATPDTIITLTTNSKFMVRETPEEIVEKVVEYRRRVGHYTFANVNDIDSISN
ncbi:MAG: flagellar FlbD family protein [candidate division KSB1 bacterium]|nr:flagellar FlbD family protein [candidate division KSB1 bacterium]